MNLFWAAFLFFPFSISCLCTTVQARAGYFHFANETARKIYHRGTPDVELEVAALINRCFIPWVNVNYVWRDGSSEGLHQKTELKMGTASLGAKMLLTYPVHFYLGLGVASAYLHLHDHSPDLPQITTRWSVGGVGKVGYFIHLHKDLFLDLFFDYYYQPVKTRSSLPEDSINLGGFRTGGGIGWFF